MSPKRFLHDGLEHSFFLRIFPLLFDLDTFHIVKECFVIAPEIRFAEGLSTSCANDDVHRLPPVENTAYKRAEKPIKAPCAC